MNTAEYRTQTIQEAERGVEVNIHNFNAPSPSI